MTEPGSDLERDLKQALRRKEPSAGFAARVIASLPQEHSRWRLGVRQPVFRWAAAAVVVIAVGGGSFAYHQHQQELAQGRAAKQQLMVALRITGSKLQLAQQRVAQIGAEHSSVSKQSEKTQ